MGKFMSKIGKLQKLHGQQQGLASFFVVIIIMIILSLLVVTFARLVGREQRQSLDRELQSQAFYAAESGVNDVRRVVNAEAGDINSLLYTSNFTNDCGAFYATFGTAYGISQAVVPGSPASVSCLLVDPAPTRLEYANLSANDSIVVPIRLLSGTLNNLEFTWYSTSANRSITCFGSSSNVEELYPDSTCDYATLRIEILPGPGVVNRANLQNNAIFLVKPYPGSATSPYSAGSGSAKGFLTGAPCIQSASDNYCRKTINGIAATSNAYIKITPLYNDATVHIRARSGSTEQRVIGSQVEVDVTAKSTDVLRRVKTYVPIPQSASAPIPSFALFSNQTQCKRFSIDTGINVPDGSAICDPTQ